MHELIQHRRTPSPTTETQTAMDIETDVHRAIDHLAVDVRITELSGERRREGDEITIDISEETDEWTVTLPTALHYWTANAPVVDDIHAPDVETRWADLVPDDPAGTPPTRGTGRTPTLQRGEPVDPGYRQRRTSPAYTDEAGERTVYRAGPRSGTDGPGPDDRDAGGPWRTVDDLLGDARALPDGAGAVRARPVNPASGASMERGGGACSDPDDTLAVTETASYDPSREDNPYGVAEEVAFSLEEFQEGSVADLLAGVFAHPDEPVSGSVETVEYGVRDEETGDVTIRETTWVDIDGYDMARGEFFVDGELADRALDAYDASAVDTATYVEADVFADEAAEICGADVTLDAVRPESEAYDGASREAYSVAA